MATAAVRSEPGYLGVSFDLWDGNVLRASPEDADPLDTPTKLDFETAIPGGHGPGNITLPRPDNFDPMDGALLAGSTIFDRANRNVHEGRVVGMPHVGVNEIQVQLEGWGKHLEADETAREIFVDVDLSHWESASVQRKINYIAANKAINDASVDPDTTTGEPSLRCEVNDTWATTSSPASVAWYNARGLPIGLVYYAWKKSASIDNTNTNWTWGVGVSTDDIETSADYTANLRAAGPGTGTLTPTAATREFALAYLSWASGVAGGTIGTEYALFWTRLAVYGNHGLTGRGTFSTTESGGFYVSDMVPYIVGKYAPLLTIAPDAIEQSSFPVPHAVFNDGGTTAKAIIEALLLFGGSTGYPLDWGVYDNKGFFLKSPGTYGDVWRVRRDEGSDSLNQGQDVEGRINGVLVSYDDGTGTTHTVGPPGSGADTETSLVTITDPDHPRNRIGEKAWKKLDAGITSAAGATLLGQLFLADKNTQEWRGDVKVTGDQRDSNGNSAPAYMIRAGDRTVLEDDSDTRERRIVGTHFSIDKGDYANKLSIGAKPDRIDVLLARAGVVVSDL